MDFFAELVDAPFDKYGLDLACGLGAYRRFMARIVIGAHPAVTGEERLGAIKAIGFEEEPCLVCSDILDGHGGIDVFQLDAVLVILTLGVFAVRTSVQDHSNGNVILIRVLACQHKLANVLSALSHAHIKKELRVLWAIGDNGHAVSLIASVVGLQCILV